MDHADHVNLLKPANVVMGGTWADFGAGSGAFTLALRELVGPHAEIYAVDKDRRGFNDLERHIARNSQPRRMFTPCAPISAARFPCLRWMGS